jgi:hypothetical protein
MGLRQIFPVQTNRIVFIPANLLKVSVKHQIVKPKWSSGVAALELIGRNGG